MAIVAMEPDSVRAPLPPLTWNEVLKRSIRDPEELCRVLQLPASWVEPARRAAREFPLFAPRGYVARMRPGDAHDPLLRQVLPLSEEQTPGEGDLEDPVGDGSATLQPGLLQKYAGRALLISTGSCAIHCRYCFRRHFPYAEAPHGMAAWQPVLETLAADPELHEIILSGGDPLTLQDGFLTQLVRQLAEIPHLRRLRVHTRLPIVIPERVTPELFGWLTGTRLTPVLVLHANHAAELDVTVAGAVERLVQAGVPVLNQTVLLRGVNDSVAALEELSERLIDLRVLPYYLHQLDRVRGARHFEVPVEEGRALVAGLRERLPGYAVPRYVQELPGQRYKLPL